MEAEPLCDLQQLALDPTNIGLKAYALPATPHQTTILQPTLLSIDRKTVEFHNDFEEI